MRTFYYDLLSYFGFTTEEISASKAHHHMTHNILAHTGVNVTLHYHWNDCESDVPKGSLIYIIRTPTCTICYPATVLKCYRIAVSFSRRIYDFMY